MWEDFLWLRALPTERLSREPATGLGVQSCVRQGSHRVPQQSWLPPRPGLPLGCTPMTPQTSTSAPLTHTAVIYLYFIVHFPFTCELHTLSKYWAVNMQRLGLFCSLLCCLHLEKVPDYNKHLMNHSGWTNELLPLNADLNMTCSEIQAPKSSLLPIYCLASILKS